VINFTEKVLRNLYFRVNYKANNGHECICKLVCDPWFRSRVIVLEEYGVMEYLTI